jgi:hypothetical protein
VPNDANTSLALANGIVALTVNAADMNSTTTATPYIDLLALAESYGLFDTAAMQVIQETGSTFATCITTMQGSLDGRNWSTVSGGTQTGAGIVLTRVISIGYRYVRMAVTTAEGGAATATLCLVLRRANA